MLKPLYDIGMILPFISAESIVVTPNERLARAISKAYDTHQASQGLQAWGKVSVVSLNRLFERWLDEARLCQGLAAQQAQYLWEQLIRQGMPNDHTTGWLSPKALAVEGYKAYELMYHYRLQSDHRFVGEMRLDSDSVIFFEWMQRFEQHLVERNWVTQAQQWQALTSLDQKLASDVIMVDFDTITPLQRAACEHVSQRIQFVRSAPAPAIDASKASVYAFQSAEEQLRQAALWARDHHRSGSFQRLGIVVPDLSSQRERLEYHLRQVLELEHADYASLPVNFSAGMAASDVSLVGAAVGVLKLAAGMLQTKELLSLARSPYLCLCSSQIEYIALRDAVHELAPTQLGHTEIALILEYMSKQVSDPGFARWWLVSRLDSGSAACLKHVMDWERILQAAGWPGQRGLDSVEYQAFKLWQRALRDFVSWDEIQSEWAVRDALKLLESSLSKTVFQPETQDQSIQILGTLEAAGLHFDQVIVLDTVAGHFPERVSMSPFLPKSLQREYRMPRSNEDQEYNLAKELLEGMAARSQRARFCYVAVADESKVAVTPVLSQLGQNCPEVELVHPCVIQGEWTLSIESKGIALPKAGGDLRGGAYRLGMHALCPMQAYSRYRLDISEETRMADGLSAKEQGLVLHRSLELLWRGKTRIEEISEDDIRPAVTEALKAISGARQALLPELAKRAERLRLEVAIRAWLDVEAQRASFDVLEHERVATLDLSGWTFTFRLDRLDVLSDDHIVVLDYKSTAPSTSTWFDGRLEQAQLPLYALALGERAKGVAFAQISATKPAKLVGVSQQGFAKGIKAIEDWDEQKRDWEQRLVALIDELEAGEASVLPSAKACRYCDFAAICRVQLAEDDEAAIDE